MRLSTDDRCRLQSRELFKPNTRYEGESDASGRIILTELVPVAGPRKFHSKDEVIRAIECSPLRFKRSWEEMRGDLREP
jgi:hypothetical protein